jgi:hypothetical protein
MSTKDLDNLLANLKDPVKFGKCFWPHVTFYREQIDIIRSVESNIETYVKAGNMLGKDFVTAFIVLYFFLTRHPCRVITTSVDSSQLEGVLWGEIRNFIATSRIPLTHDKGGPIIDNHLHLRKVVKGKTCGLSYVLGRVAKKGEGLLGHHIADRGDGIPRTLAIGDEASGLDDDVHTRCTTWAKRLLFIGNPYPCSNFFKKYCQEGDARNPNNKRQYFRKVYKIKGDDSPNVRRALEEIRHGLIPSGKMIVPGVLPYDDYLYRRTTWDKIRQHISLDAEFYEGSEILLYPPDWLDRAERRFNELRGRKRIARAIGIDPAEGGDKTSLCAVDEYGMIDVEACKTPDTNEIVGMVIAFGHKHGAPPENWVFDRGGGGKQIADRIRAMGGQYAHVRTVGFGESVSPNPKRGMKTLTEQVDNREERYTYVNRRAQLFHDLSQLLDPSSFGIGDLWGTLIKRYKLDAEQLTGGFAILPNVDIRKQMAMIPKLYDKEGRIRMLPKNKTSKESSEKTLVEIIGHSPDELDSTVLAVYGMLYKGTKVTIGGF